LLFGIFFDDPISLLELTDKLFSLSVDDVKIVTSQVAPFLLRLTFELLPFSLDLIPIHLVRPLCRGCCVADRNAGLESHVSAKTCYRLVPAVVRAYGVPNKDQVTQIHRYDANIAAFQTIVVPILAEFSHKNRAVFKPASLTARK